MGAVRGLENGERRVGTGQFVRIGLVVSLIALVVGSVQFARYDWTGVRFQRSPESVDRTISPDCHEQIRPFETSTGRIITPSALDEQQYVSMIDRFRGGTDLQIECFYEPFTDRAAVPWIASLLPVEDALSLGLVNTAFLLVGIWLVLAALVVQGFGARVVLAVGVLLSANWVVFAFGTSLLIESAPFAVVALCWLLISQQRWWWVVPVLAVGVVLKETAVLALPPLWVALLPASARPGSLARRLLPAAVATAGAFVAYVVRGGLGPEPGASWPTGIDLGLLSFNLGPPGLVVLAAGLAPLLVPAALWFTRRVRTVGWVEAGVDPAVVGVLGGLGLLAWILVTADLSPRFFWPCFPFAATLCARWLSEGRAAEVLQRWSLPRSLVGPGRPGGPGGEPLGQRVGRP